MHVLTNQAPAPTPMAGIRHVTLAGSAEGLRNLSVWQQSVEAGGATPPHSHSCEEVVLCTGGAGELHIDGRVERFGAGQTLVIPANADHQIFSVGPEPLETIGIFAMSPVPVHLPSGEAIELPWRS